MSANTLVVITNSQMKCYRRCAREHLFAYVQLRRPLVEAETLRFGMLIHIGLEAWWRASRDGALDAALAAMAKAAADPYEMARAEVALRGYEARWSAETMLVLAVEAEFRAPLINPETGHPSRTYELAGKLDVVVEHEGRTKLIEHKTSSEDIGAGSDYWKRLCIDPQISTYFAGGKASGYEISECIYDVLGKPALRPSAVALLDDDGAKIVHDANGERVRTKTGKWRETGDSAQGYVLQTRPETPDEFRARLTAHVAENPDRYYQRGTVVRLEQEEADAAFDTWATARLIREAELANRWPRNPDACVRFGRTCSYFPVCTGAGSIDDDTQFRTVDHAHQELNGAA